MAYTKIIYQDSPSTATPLNAQNLNHMDDGIAENDRRLNDLAIHNVKSFNGREGDIVSANGDYDITQIAPTNGATEGQIPILVNVGTEEAPELQFELDDVPQTGHTIQGADGTDLAQEPTLQFADMHTSDDSVHLKTVIQAVKAVIQADYSSETEDGIYLVTDGDGAAIGPASEDYVEVTADGEKTRAQLLTDLDALVDWTKVNENSYIVFGNDIYRVNVPNVKIFMTSTISVGHLYNTMFDLKYHTSQQYDTTSNGSTLTDNSSAVPTSGRTITLYYGNKKATVDLQTTANRCLMQTGVEMSVDSALGYMRFYHISIANGESVTLNFGATDRFTIYLTHSSTAGRTYVGIGCGGTNPHLDDIFPNANITKTIVSKTITLTNNTGGSLSGWVEIQQTGTFSIT